MAHGSWLMAPGSMASFQQYSCVCALFSVFSFSFPLVFCVHAIEKSSQ